jgi:hypothetical protein
MEKFARRLGYEATASERGADRFLYELEQDTSQTRELFLYVLAREQAKR